MEPFYSHQHELRRRKQTLLPLLSFQKLHITVRNNSGTSHRSTLPFYISHKVLARCQTIWRTSSTTRMRAQDQSLDGKETLPRGQHGEIFKTWLRTSLAAPVEAQLHVHFWRRKKQRKTVQNRHPPLRRGGASVKTRARSSQESQRNRERILYPTEMMRNEEIREADQNG